ncbi:MAG: LLM class flavin-dependent oxidoreductase [Alphaproteobacteria bacterium]|nr:LLM class flavin-dependent oxidoreductase [Alphaproteobacteria bacterium]
MKLNILCQSPVSEGSTPEAAVQNTVALAREADGLGYHRFWVAEHHSDRALASAAPDVLMAHLASITTRLRIGSGGVLLPYYSPLAVAERFNLLEALFPGRIDLGIGRSGGSEGHAPEALGVRGASFEAVDELLAWLGPGTAARPFGDTFASPAVDRCAEPWVLGTSPASARYAGSRGLPYAFGGFLDPRQMMPALSEYHQSFRPGRFGDRPRVNLAWYVQAAPTEAEAHALTRSSEHWFVEALLRRRNPRFPDPATIRDDYTPMERMAIEMRRHFALVGTPDQVLTGLEALARQTAADELTLVTIPFEHEARVESYRLLGRAA